MFNTHNVSSTLSRVKTYYGLSSERGRDTAHRVLQGVSLSKNLMILSGSGVSIAAGLEAFSSNALDRNLVPFTDVEWKSVQSLQRNTRPTVAQQQAIGKVMTSYRIRARQAPLTPFHHFLHKKMDAGDCRTCLTQNFDGLEFRDREDLSGNVVMLHGDNTVLTCSASNCAKVRGIEVHAFDAQFLDGDTIVCPKCKTRAEQNKRSRVVPKPLRADVQLHSLSPLVRYESLIEEAETIDTLLIIGASVLELSVYSLVDELARAVHLNQGKVVYVDNNRSVLDHLGYLIDFHILADAQECASAMLEMSYSSSRESAADVWEEFSEPLLPGGHVAEDIFTPGRRCTQCCLALPDVLVSCISCGREFCRERADDPLGITCLVLNGMVPLDSETQPQQEASFFCPRCHDYTANPTYPHIVRSARYLHESPETAPRLLLIVFYLSQFYPDAVHMVSAIRESWTLQGWECCFWPVALHSLEKSQQRDSLPKSWSAKTYSSLVIYITHSLVKEIQIDDRRGVSAHEFLSKTTQRVRSALRDSGTTVAFLMACGSIYKDAAIVTAMKEWVDSQGTFNSLVATLNERLSPAYMVEFASQAAVSMLGFNGWAWQGLAELWLRNTLANGHTDLIYFQEAHRPRVFLFSPFQTRPLGISLPSLLNTCLCQSTRDKVDRAGSQKVWIVKHNGKKQMNLSLVVIKATCSSCRMTWRMQKPGLTGQLWIAGGLYAAIANYFAADR